MGESDFYFQRDRQYSYRSLVSANTPRGADVMGVLFLDFPSECCPTTNFTEVFSIDNACFVAGRWFGL